MGPQMNPKIAFVESKSPTTIVDTSYSSA